MTNKSRHVVAVVFAAAFILTLAFLVVQGMFDLLGETGENILIGVAIFFFFADALILLWNQFKFKKK